MAFAVHVDGGGATIRLTIVGKRAENREEEGGENKRGGEKK